MIGILGRLNPPEEALARRALAAVPHPTPDIRFLRLGSALLGIATRPDFVDESLSADGSLVAALTGRLDNAADLHRELTAAGHAPASPADADVVVAAFRAFGPDVVNRFRGAFAGIVTDGRTLWCFRDHVGFRPLFFRDDPAAFVAASESRPVAVAAGISQEPDLRVLEWIMFQGMPSNTPTALKGVQRQAQGTIITAGVEGSPQSRRYWFPWNLLETARISGADAQERFLELLGQAARRSVTGRDVVLLSGGLDSPMVAAYAAPEHLRMTGRPIGALSAVFPDLPAVDESRYIQIAADRFGMKLETFVPTARALDDVEAWCQRFATPVPTLSIPEIWDVYSKARQLGYQNVITGEFAELTFGKWPHLLAHLLAHGRFRALATVMAEEHARGASRRDLILDALTGLVPGRLLNLSLVLRGKDSRHDIPDWLDGRRFSRWAPRRDFRPPARRRWEDMQLWGTQGSTITMEADAICGVMAGVTIRRPLADVDLWEFFLSLPGEIKFPVLQWKALARRSLRGVIPDEILDRPRKTVFNDHMMQQIDYPTLRRLLVAPTYRVPGVNYERLAERLQREDLGFLDWVRVKELARCHAFLNTF